MSLIFNTRDGARLKISTEALVHLQAFAQHAPDAVEAGGLLLGRVMLSGPPHDVIIDEITTPFPDDEATRFTFTRQSPGHQHAINAAWERSGGTCSLLGHWHTHAEPDPTPSDVDELGWREDLVEWKYDSNSLLFVIVGTEQVRAWSGSKHDRSVEELELLGRPRAIRPRPFRIARPLAPAL